MKRKLIDPDAVQRLAAEGKTIPEIAKLLDFSNSGVRHCCEMHGLKPKLAQHGRKAGFKVKPAPVAATKKIVTPVNARLSDETAAHESKTLAEIKQATHADERPCVTHKPTPVEALTLKIKLPWAGKVQQQTPADLAPDLYDELLAYGAGNIAEMFGFTAEGWQVWLKKYGYPVGGVVRSEAWERLKTAVTSNEIKIDHPTPVFRAYDFAAGDDANGLNYQDRHCLGIYAPHAPTPAELTEIFEPAPPVGLLQTAERLAELIKQREHLRQEQKLVAGMLGKIDASIEECLKIIQEAAR